MRYLIAVTILIVAFLVMCFHWPVPERRYHLMADPHWYKLDITGLEPVPVEESKSWCSGFSLPFASFVRCRSIER